VVRPGLVYFGFEVEPHIGGAICSDGEMHSAELPLSDKAGEIPRGKIVDIPQRG